MILLYNGSHHIPTGGFIYDLYSHGIIGVIVYGHVINIIIYVLLFLLGFYGFLAQPQPGTTVIYYQYQTVSIINEFLLI